MSSLQTLVEEFRATATSDDNFIEAIESLIQTEGDLVCTTLFQVLCSLEVRPQQAQKYWREIIAHRQTMSERLHRTTSLMTATCDYFHHFSDLLLNPKLVEVSTFDNVFQKSIYDNLTGLFNRAYFDETLEQQLSSASRYHSNVSILFLDVDNFKNINDTYGHQTGDYALQNIAEIIEYEKRDSDIAARFGGEEFVLLMPHTGTINALVLAERIRTKVAEQVIEADGHSFSVTISGGLASFPVDALDSDSLLKLADSAVYQAKGAGKNIISSYKKDKRRYLRVKFNQPIMIKELGFANSNTFAGQSKDIGIGGILFENSEPIPIGARVQVSIPIKNDAPLLLIGTIVRVEAYGHDNYDIGMIISFDEMQKIANTEIANVLRENKN